MTSIAAARAPRIRGARAVFTSREGGVSGGDHASLNLAHHVGDDRGSVDRNRELLAAEIGAPLVFADQVHSPDVHVVTGAGEVPVHTADALVTDRSDIALAIMVADCAPVLLADGQARVVGAAHAGRAGLLAGVLENTVAAMAELGADPGRIEVSVGPSICGACYEVPRDMARDADARLPGAAVTTRWGSAGIDLRAGAVRALENAGVAAERIDADPPCTLEDLRFFSYRRAGATGRFAGAIRLLRTEGG